MIRLLTCLPFLLLTIVAVTGCAGTQRHVASFPPEEADRGLSEGYTLLYRTLDANQAVDQVFLLKGGSDEFKALIRAIADTCEEQASLIEEFAEGSSSISLEASGLPAVEVATRHSIEGAAAGAIMKASGQELQERLTVEQLEATRYVTQLAKVLSESDSDPDRSRALETMSAVFQGLYDRLWIFIESSDAANLAP